MEKWILIILILFAIENEVLGADDRDYGSYEGKLQQHLLANRKPIDLYSPSSFHSNYSIHVQFGISLIGIIEVSAIRQSVTANLWMRMIWTDNNLQWKSEDYGGIDLLRIPQNMMWKPDILLVNSVAESDYSEDKMHTLMLVYPDGMIMWLPSVTVESSCALDLTYFPFDEHVCSWIFRSWSLESKDLGMDWYGNKREIDLSDFWKNSEWHIEKLISDDNDVTDTEHKTLTYFIHLKRHGSFYTATLLLPIVLSWLLQLLFFWLPLWTGYRLLLSLLTLFFLQAILVQINYIIPTNGSSVPLIVILCSESFVFTALSVVFSVLFLSMVRTAIPPNFPICITNVLTGWPGKLLCLDNSTIHRISLQVRLLNWSQIDVPTNSSTGAATKEHENDKRDGREDTLDIWILMATALNRILFLIYSLVFSITFIITVIGIS